MIRLRTGDCTIDILPVIKGLISEADKVRNAYGGYEAYAVALGVEEVEAVRRRKELGDEYELGELDMVYAYRLSAFGEIQTPTPAFCEMIDLCARDMKNVIPLDMNDETFTSAYIESVHSTEFVKEHRLAKKGMKYKFDFSSPEVFAMDWDRFVNSVKGYARVSAERERYIAHQLIDTARYRKTLLAIIEIERIDGIIARMKEVADVKELSELR